MERGPRVSLQRYTTQVRDFKQGFEPFDLQSSRSALSYQNNPNGFPTTSPPFRHHFQAPPKTMTKMNFTIGIELEFICVCNKKALRSVPELQEYYEEDEFGSSGRAIWHFLKRNGIMVSGFEELGQVEPPAHTTWSVKYDESVSLTEEEEIHLPPESSGWEQESIEIASPAMLASSAYWQAQLGTVLETLQWMSTNLPFQFLVNNTAGLHVHIGNNFGEQMPLKLVKRMLQLSTAHESRIDSLHIGDRIRAPGLDVPPFNNASNPVSTREESREARAIVYCAPLALFFRDGARRADAADFTNVFFWLQQIEKAISSEKLGSMIDTRVGGLRISGHNCVLNLDNLYPRQSASQWADPPINTVEFRQHAASLDFHEIGSWVTFVIQMTTFCHTTEDANLIDLLLKSADLDFKVSDLLHRIGCSGLVEHYSSQNRTSTQASTNHTDLNALVSTNARDRQANIDTTATRIDQKYLNSYYGLDPSACKFPIGADFVKVMLQCASNDLLAIAPVASHDDLANISRVNVFQRLGLMYRDMDSSVDPSTAIVENLSDWLAKYPQMQAIIQQYASR